MAVVPFGESYEYPEGRAGCVQADQFQVTHRLLQIPEMEGLTIPGARCDHVRDCQTGALLFCVIHPRIFGLARRIRNGDENVWVNSPHLRERKDYGNEKRNDLRGHVCSNDPRIKQPVVQKMKIICGRPSEGGCESA